MMKKAISVVLGCLGLVGCAGVTQRSTQIEVWDDMKRQQKYRAQSANPVFADGRTQQAPPDGVVAVGLLKEDEGYSTGKTGGMYVGKNPLLAEDKIGDLKATLELGQKRFETYCSPCHGRAGDGLGIVPAKVPTWKPQNLHEARLREYPDGEFFDVISHGRRSMKGYRFQISERDRWAIVAYIRVLQRKDGVMEDVPENLRASVR